MLKEDNQLYIDGKASKLLGLSSLDNKCSELSIA